MNPPAPRRTRRSAVTSLAASAACVGVAACGGGSASTVDAGARLDAAADHAVASAADAADAAASRADASLPDASSDASPPDAGSTCHATPAAADRVRAVVVSHPYDAAQNASGDFEVFALDATGALSQPNVHFTLGATTAGAVAFTPDGQVGLVAEDDGTLGVFRIDASGAAPQVTVVAASLKLGFYAGPIVMDPSGARAYVLDDETANNGGGVYTVAIACDGTVTSLGLLASANLPAAVLPLANGNAVVAAKSFLGVPATPDGGVLDAALDAAASGPANDAVLVPWPSATSVLGTADPFGDDQAIVSSAALTSDGRYALFGDTSAFASVPNRVGVVTVSATGASAITGVGYVPNINDPQALVASPFDDTVLVVSGFGNALYVLAPSTDAGSVPFALAAPVTYVGAAPQLPGSAILIGRGTLEGRVVIAENQAIRQAAFGKQGGVTDLGAFPTGSANSFTSIVGAIGVQP